jgi:hypothetical protein
VKTIWRIDVAINDDSTVARLPWTAQPVHVGLCSNTPPMHLSVWLAVDDDVSGRDFRFRVIGTGHPADGLMYVGTVPMGALVWHVMVAR